jgi:GntR family transcriptional regulator
LRKGNSGRPLLARDTHLGRERGYEGEHGVARGTARQALSQLVNWGLAEHVQALLGLDPGARAVLRSRRYVLDGKPVLLSRSWLSAAITSGTPIAQRDTGPGGIYARLAELGHAPARFREDLRSRMPLPDEAERLQIAAGTPIVEISRVALDANGFPVEVNEMTADSSAYIFRYEFSA